MENVEMAAKIQFLFNKIERYQWISMEENKDYENEDSIAHDYVLLCESLLVLMQDLFPFVEVTP